jgi:intracellular multiplication protein IcmO
MASQKKFKGVDAREEKLIRDLNKDVRPASQKFIEWLGTTAAAVIPITIAIVIVAFPNWAWFAFLINLPLILYHTKKVSTLPFKKPVTSGEKDKNQLHPATGKPEMAKGISFYGNDINTAEQLWFANDDVRTHTLIFGTTGSGKTEALLSICVNSLVQSSGFIYVDGKGDNSLLAKVFSIVRRFGREDDLLVINYMTGTVDLNKKTFEKLSNTMNPFASGSADSLTELIVSLLPDGGGDGMWKGRAAVFMSALMRVLVNLRDNRKILLDVDQIRKHFSLEKITELCFRDDIEPKHKAGLEEYLFNLPGYKKPTPQEPNPEQDFGVYEQHGFITMQYTESFGLLSDTYGHIMKTQLAEVDFYDVVVNRRILVVLLPALEKSPQSLANLGKIIVASVRSMMSAALGSRVEGNRKDVIDQKPTNAPSPYLTIFDEYGYYSVEGAAVMPAQARSLGFAMVFAGQDYQAFKKGSPEEAASIVANCAVKICMKLEDPSETLDIFNKAAGQAKVTASGGYQYSAETGMAGSYVDQGNVSFENKERLSSRDLKSQGPGEAHIIFGDTLIRAKMFFANPVIVDNVQLNTFIKVKAPSYEKVKLLKSGYTKVTKRFNEVKDDPSKFRGNLHEIMGSSGFESEMGTIIKAFKATKNIKNSNLKAFFALASYSERVAFVDNKVIYEIEEIEKPEEIKEIQQEAAQKRKKAAEESKAAKPVQEKKERKERKAPEKAEKTSVLEKRREAQKQENSKDKDSSSGKKNTTQRLREMVAEQQSAFEKLKSSPFNPYEKMGINEEELRNSLVETEKNISSAMKGNDLLDNDDEIDDDYNDLVAQQTVTSIGMSTSYPSKKNKLASREENEQYINNIVESILIDGIDDE